MLLLEKWERQALADRQTLMARGVSDDLPSLADVQRGLNEALSAEPKPPVEAAVDDEQMELRRALGVA